MSGAGLVTPPARGASLRVHGVSKRFGVRAVLQDVSLDLPRGGFAALIGESGCGKSTLLRLLAGLEKRDAGRVSLTAGERRPPDASEEPRVRMVFQDGRLLPWRNTLDNVGLGRGGDWRPQARALLAEVGLEGREQDFPSTLSGGQRQRVALARALLHEPDLLLLDEPLGALDALTRLQMQGLLERLWQHHGFTALLVTHDIAEAVALADRIYVLEEGHIRRSFDVDLPRPRDRHGARFQALSAEILGVILERRG